MCSWCWGFRKVWNQVQHNLKDYVNIRTVIGGLAPDSDQIMSETMQKNIQQNWQRIQQHIPGTQFNYNFWKVCKPRRSTYPACRAVIAASLQGDQFSKMMISAIQQAYYLDAKNPSDDRVLIQLAIDIDLDSKQFETDFFSNKCKQLFYEDLRLTASLKVNGFPNLILNYKNSNNKISIDYNNKEVIILSIQKIIA
jgi:putative protein-disulfide isomerase